MEEVGVLFGTQDVGVEHWGDALGWLWPFFAEATKGSLLFVVCHGLGGLCSLGAKIGARCLAMPGC
jgi:hypothetical protein